QFILCTHFLEAVAHSNPRTRSLGPGRQRPFKQRIPRARHRSVIACRYNRPAVTDDLGTVADVRSDTWHVAGHRLAQHVGKAFTCNRTQREHIKCGIYQLDVRSRAKQNNITVEVESPNQLCQAEIVAAEPIAAEDEFYILMFMLEA